MTVQEDEAIESLGGLGLTSYEAKVFIALHKLGTGTARDVSRVADVPRSQVYGVTESLEDRGLVEVQQSSPIRYRAVSIEEARSTLRERFERESDAAFEYVETVREEFGQDDEEQEDIWMVRGQERVSDRAAELVRRANESVVFAARTTELVGEDVDAALRERADDGLSVVVLSESPEVRALYADHPVIQAVEPRTDTHVKDEHTGRAVFGDDDILLLSVLGGDEELPGINRETAFWSANTSFAQVLVQLVETTITPDA
ncbi:TrmB family transcriptional regulator [Haloarchaeobius sp. HRN-SO-5]|uniref:TrmB family transcriptional regulator n=1 Tax=Haloarchaeobius sp. HRN-SO-5 TaxID=3446118 RepID=UPI003EB86594